MALTDRNKAQMGDVRAFVAKIAGEVCERWPVAFLWGKTSSGSGEHPKGLALDFSVLAYGNGPDDPGPADPGKGDQIAAYLWEHRKRLSVWYVIWNRRIISTNPDGYAHNRWTKYRGSNPHVDHVHVSFYSHGTYTPPEDDMPLTNDDLRKIADRVWRWDHIRNTSITDKKSPAYTWTPATFLSHLEHCQDQQFKALRNAIGEIGKALGPQVEKAIHHALKDATVDVDGQQPDEAGQDTKEEEEK